MKVHISVSDNDKDAPPWSLESDLNGEVTYEDFTEFGRRSIWMIAEEALKEEQTRGFDKEPRTRTDNKWGKEPREVKFGGKIEYFARQIIGEALIDAYDMIHKRSPVDTGQYKSSHYVYVNQKFVASNENELKMWVKFNASRLQDSDVIRIANVTPYASRIEMRGGRRGTRGKDKDKNISKVRTRKMGGVAVVQGNGTYALAARAVRSKYKATGSINFQMIPNGYAGLSLKVSSGIVGGKQKTFRTTYIEDTGRFNKRKRFSGPYVYPSIVFRLSGQGILQ